MTWQIVGNDELRFWSKVEITGFCWLWTGNRNIGGYGVFPNQADRPSHAIAHRWAYEHLVGPIADGLQIDHLCRIRLCVNPDHLEPVTVQENLRRGFGAVGVNIRKTACKYGHPFDEVNTYITKRGKRHCRACHAASERARRAAA